MIVLKIKQTLHTFVSKLLFSHGLDLKKFQKNGYFVVVEARGQLLHIPKQRPSSPSIQVPGKHLASLQSEFVFPLFKLAKELQQDYMNYDVFL